MKTIRKGTFETNSSSCHVVTIVREDLLERYRNNEVVCIINLDLEEYKTVKNVLKSYNFYDIDKFYELVQEAKKLSEYTELGYYEKWLLNASKEELYNVFFKGEIPEDINAMEFLYLGDYLFPNAYIYAHALNIGNDDPLFTKLEDEDNEETAFNGVVTIEKDIVC